MTNLRQFFRRFHWLRTQLTVFSLGIVYAPQTKILPAEIYFFIGPFRFYYEQPYRSSDTL